MSYRNVSSAFLVLFLMGFAIETNVEAQLLRRNGCCRPNRCRPMLGRLSALRCRLQEIRSRRDCNYYCKSSDLDCAYQDRENCAQCMVSVRNGQWMILSDGCEANCYCPVPITVDYPLNKQFELDCAPSDDGRNEPDEYLFQLGLGELSSNDEMPEKGFIFCRPNDLRDDETTDPIQYTMYDAQNNEYTMTIDYRTSQDETDLDARTDGVPFSLYYYNYVQGGTSSAQKATIRVSGTDRSFVFSRFTVTIRQN